MERSTQSTQSSSNLLSMFDKGQKIACVNDHFSATIRRLCSRLPLKNQVYTVETFALGV